jgi:hypothetical protein
MYSCYEFARLCLSVPCTLSAWACTFLQSQPNQREGATGRPWEVLGNAEMKITLTMNDLLEGNIGNCLTIGNALWLFSTQQICDTYRRRRRTVLECIQVRHRQTIQSNMHHHARCSEDSSSFFLTQRPSKIDVWLYNILQLFFCLFIRLFVRFFVFSQVFLCLSAVSRGLPRLEASAETYGRGQTDRTSPNNRQTNEHQPTADSNCAFWCKKREIKRDKESPLGAKIVFGDDLWGTFPERPDLQTDNNIIIIVYYYYYYYYYIYICICFPWLL